MERSPDTITTADVQMADGLRRQSELADMELFCAIMGGAEVSPDVSITSLLRRIEEMERRLPGDLRLTMVYVCHLGKRIYQTARFRRAMAERSGNVHWQVSSLGAWLSLGLLAVRLIGGPYVVSLSRLQAVLHYLHS